MAGEINIIEQTVPYRLGRIEEQLHGLARIERVLEQIPCRSGNPCPGVLAANVDMDKISERLIKVETRQSTMIGAAAAFGSVFGAAATYVGQKILGWH